VRWRESAMCMSCIHSEARLVPTDGDSRFPSCLLRSRNAWKTSLTASVRSIAAMGRGARNDTCVVIYFMQPSGSYLHLQHLVPVAASRF
jgi:hypothetical protein